MSFDGHLLGPLPVGSRGPSPRKTVERVELVIQLECLGHYPESQWQHFDSYYGGAGLGDEGERGLVGRGGGWCQEVFVIPHWVGWVVRDGVQWNHLLTSLILGRQLPHALVYPPAHILVHVLGLVWGPLMFGPHSGARGGWAGRRWSHSYFLVHFCRVNPPREVSNYLDQCIQFVRHLITTWNGHIFGICVILIWYSSHRYTSFITCPLIPFSFRTWRSNSCFSPSCGNLSERLCKKN